MESDRGLENADRVIPGGVGGFSRGEERTEGRKDGNHAQILILE